MRLPRRDAPRDAGLDDLRAAREPRDAVRRDVPQADHEVGREEEAVDPDLRSVFRVVETDEVFGTVPPVLDDTAGIEDRTPDLALRLLTRHRTVGAERDHDGDVLGRDAALSEFFEQQRQDPVRRRVSGVVVDQDEDRPPVRRHVAEPRRSDRGRQRPSDFGRIVLFRPRGDSGFKDCDQVAVRNVHPFDPGVGKLDASHAIPLPFRSGNAASAICPSSRTRSREASRARVPRRTLRAWSTSHRRVRRRP